jgi:hypothetical protein
MALLSSSVDPNEVTRVRNRRFSVAGFPLQAIVLLLLTAAISLLWSKYTMLRGDEPYELWTDGVSSIGRLIEIQLTSPIVLDPFAYHAIAHTATAIFGANAFAIRLPSLLGFLLMQICLFIFVRRVATERAALFALGFPALTAALDFSMNGRPYAVMLGLFGLAMVSWQTATLRESKRTGSLIILALAVALTLNTHYFGVLLLAPLVVAEAFRTFQRRTLDLPVLVSIGTGTAGIIFVLPFMRAAAEFRSHYYSVLDNLNFKAIIRAYLLVLLNNPFKPLPASYLNHNQVFFNWALFAVVVAVIVVSLVAGAHRLRSTNLSILGASKVFLAALAALPLFGFLLARFTSHVLEPRFVFGLIIGVSALAALGLSSLLQRDRAGRIILVWLFAVIVCNGVLRIYWARMATQEALSSLILQPEIKAEMMASPAKLLYIQSWGDFAIATYYEPDPEVRSRIALVYSHDQELTWRHATHKSLSALHMRNFTEFNIVSYESLTKQPGDHLFAVCSGEDDWTERALASVHAKVSHVGPAFICGSGPGEMLSVHFLP